MCKNDEAFSFKRLLTNRQRLPYLYRSTRYAHCDKGKQKNDFDMNETTSRNTDMFLATEWQILLHLRIRLFLQHIVLFVPPLLPHRL